MKTDGGKGQGGESQEGTPPAGTETPPPQAGTEGTDPPEGTEESTTLSAADAKKLRSENKNLRDRMKAAEQERDTLKQAQLTDKEKLEVNLGKSNESNQALRAQNRDLRVQVHAQRVGIVDPEIASALIDWDEVGDDDQALDSALKQIVKDKPYLTGGTAGGSDGGARGGRTSQSGDMNTLLRRGAGVIR